jgi:hypothetical protein
MSRAASFGYKEEPLGSDRMFHALRARRIRVRLGFISYCESGSERSADAGGVGKAAVGLEAKYRMVTSGPK